MFSRPGILGLMTAAGLLATGSSAFARHPLRLPDFKEGVTVLTVVQTSRVPAVIPFEDAAIGSGALR